MRPNQNPEVGHEVRRKPLGLVPGALRGEEGPVFLHVGRDEEPQGGVAAAVVRPGLLPVAVSAAAGEAALPIGVELVDGLDGPAG